MRWPASWSARDCRQFVALTLLAAGALPLSAAFVLAQITVWHDPDNKRAEHLGMAAAMLIGIDLFGVSAILGRRTFKLKVGSSELGATGEDGDRVLNRSDAA